MRNLCDSNVLVAAAAQHHSHHDKAARWMNELGDEDSVVLCRATQLTFLRLLTTESVMKGGVQTNRNALAVLHAMMGDPRFVFVREEPQDIEGWAAWADLRTASPKLWMDAYLAAMAKGLSCRLVTFDRGFARFRSGGLDVLVL